MRVPDAIHQTVTGSGDTVGTVLRLGVTNGSVKVVNHHATQTSHGGQGHATTRTIGGPYCHAGTNAVGASAQITDCLVLIVQCHEERVSVELREL